MKVNFITPPLSIITVLTTTIIIIIIIAIDPDVKQRTKNYQQRIQTQAEDSNRHQYKRIYLPKNFLNAKRIPYPKINKWSRNKNNLWATQKGISAFEPTTYGDSREDFTIGVGRINKNINIHKNDWLCERTFLKHELSFNL